MYNKYKDYNHEICILSRMLGHIKNAESIKLINTSKYIIHTIIKYNGKDIGVS